MMQPGDVGMRVAFAHDWLTGMRGGEKVLEALCGMFPGAPVHTLVHVRGSVSPAIEAHPVRPAFTNALPAIARLYRHYLLLFPAAVETFDLDEADLVISTSHCAVKSVVRTGRARHLCYCHSPMRYAWDQFPWYFGPSRLGAWSRPMRAVMRRLASWDAATSHRVDRYVANSQYVAARIRRYYNRESAVVYPPVDTRFFQPTGEAPGESVLVVSALVPYKRIDLAVEACRLAGIPLRIVGSGPEEPKLRQMAGPGTEFLGTRSNDDLRTLYSTARAVLLPGVEDFGIVPVEAQACGRPVVALARGGATETVVDGVTGVLVRDDTPAAFADALRQLDMLPLDPHRIRDNALRFAPERFVAGMQEQVAAVLGASSTAGVGPRTVAQGESARAW